MWEYQVHESDVKHSFIQEVFTFPFCHLQGNKTKCFANCQGWTEKIKEEPDI